jgi:hypothetical protein
MLFDFWFLLGDDILHIHSFGVLEGSLVVSDAIAIVKYSYRATISNEFRGAT